MAAPDDIFARDEAEPIYVLEWDCKSLAIPSALSASAAELAASPGTFGGWPSFGYAEWDDGTGEILAWSGVSLDGSALRNLRRGIHGSPASAHDAGALLREYGLWRPLLSRPHAGFPDGIACLGPPQLGAVSIDPRKGSAALSPIRLVLSESPHPSQGTAGFVADLVAHVNGPSGNGLRSRRAALRLGFKELAGAADFAVIARGLVSEAEVQAQGTRLSLSLRPLHGTFKDRRLFVEKRTALTAAVTAVGGELLVGDETRLLPPGADAGYVRVDDEILSYSSVSAGKLQGLSRGLLGSVAASHEQDAEVRQVYVLGAENPLTLFLQVALSTGAGTNGPYDVLPKEAGLGIPAALVNAAKVESVREESAAGARMRFAITEEVTDAKQWIESQLLQPAGCSLLLDDAGTISVSFYGPVSPSEVLPRLDADSLIRGSGLSARLGLEGVSNVAEVRYSRDPVSGEFLSRLLLVDNDSISAHGESKKHVLELDGIHGSVSTVDPQPLGDVLAELLALRFVGRYAAPRKQIHWSAPLPKARLPVGSLVEVGEDRLPASVLDERRGLAYSKGSPGTLYEIVSRRVDYAKGLVQLELLESEFTGLRFLFLQADGAPDYSAASSTDKRLGYLCADADDLVTLNSNPIPFADGGGPYRVYPA